MTNTMSESLFLQDNLLSEDDWGTLSLVDLSDLTSTSPESVSNEFYIDDEAKYQDYGSFSDDSEGKQGNANLLKDEFNHASPEHQDMVDELLNDLLQAKTTAQQGCLSDDFLQNVEGFPPRRCSTNTSSSAYSSCSSDPSTPPPLSDPASDQASCSSGEHCLDYLIQDHGALFDGSPDALDTTLLPTGENQSPPHVFIHNENEQTRTQNLPPAKTVAEKSRKTERCRYNPKPPARKTEESDLEKAVRIACEETNRLLKMHRSLSGKTCDSSAEKSPPPQQQQQRQKDILTDLCEKTILNSPTMQSTTTTTTTNKQGAKNNVNKPTKRKASPLQDAIDRLHLANKKPSLLKTGKTQQTTPFSRSALLNANTKAKTIPKEVQVEPIGLVNNEPCIVLSQPQRPVTHQIALDGVTINPSPTYTITTNPGPSMTPIQLYVKQETPTLQTYPIINGIIQTPTSSCTIGNQKFYLSSGLNTTTSVSLGTVASPVVVKPEQLICAGGQTIVVQAPKPATQPALQPVNISDMKPGADPLVLSQSDLSRLAAQGVIKFPGKKAERNLKPSAEFVQQPVKECKLAVSSTAQSNTPAVCDLLPSDAAGVINGTSVFVSGSGNQPQRGELDIKALKRHQRMIKNRASACQSRQRRKEYLKTLEDQVTEIAEDNRQLREENGQLRARVRELEIQNTSLRNVIGIQRTNQKKAACVMMLVLFVGINFSPVGFRFFGDKGGMTPFQSDDTANGEYDSGLPLSVQPGVSTRTGRHLLSLSQGEENGIRMEKYDGIVENGSKTSENQLILSEKQSFWMDDLVQEYKNKHLEKFLQILSETASLSTQRMLRRKLKEELGIRIPLPVPRHRRIAYTPRSSRQKVDRTYQYKMDRDADAKVPPQTIPFKDGDSMRIQTPLPQPCEHPSMEDIELNETETSRVNDDLTQWAQRYSVDMQAKARKQAEKADVVKKSIPNTKAPSSRYALSDNSSTNEIALYARPNKKFDDFLDAINRRNDTFYVVSLNRDHLLLPASVQNTSSRMKMALVMPAITSKERPHLSEEYETMIHIECEVLNTRMFDLKRKDVPDFLNVPVAKPTIKTLENVSNDTISESGTRIKPTLQRPKNTKSRPKSNKAVGKGTKSKVKLEDQRHEQQRQQEEDAVVTEVVESSFYKDD